MLQDNLGNDDLNKIFKEQYFINTSKEMLL